MLMLFQQKGHLLSEVIQEIVEREEISLGAGNTQWNNRRSIITMVSPEL